MLFENIPVMPIQQMLGSPFGRSEHKLGPVWPDWDNAGSVRFFRKGKPKDDKPWVGPNTPFRYKTGKYVWCGPIVNHFGHQIADFCTRIAVYRDYGCTYLFSVRKGQGFSYEDVPLFLKQIFEWFGINSSDILFVEQPVIVEKLYVEQQQEHLPQEGPSYEYLDILDDNTTRNGLFSQHKSGVYYISRAGMLKGMLAGERYIENIMQANGITVIKPECLPLKEQLAIYAQAETLIFSEGSAIHGLQLLGHINCNVRILKRRPNVLMAKGLLTPRTKELTYHDIGYLVAGLRADGSPATDAGITICDKDRVKEFICSQGLSIRGWNDEAFMADVRVDVKAFLDAEKCHVRSQVQGHFDTILAKLQAYELI
ncbi:glycosyltransferase 61 family protein [uncultured Alteromonas sp.]|jgi:hypothetical protein|uniref:glycosyltransferase 61 family protein n=1 Tax=uncultured Alteromonas sp. TaxID=179113 RepID=UPI0025D4D3BB|nr:glycosyltransferase 61 family protein [uncultured Alteromonas sp.]